MATNASLLKYPKQKLINHNLSEVVDLERERFFTSLESTQRSKMGQFGTPFSVARLMTSMFVLSNHNIKLLDAGAGVGSLTAAFVEEACSRAERPSSIYVKAFEVDKMLHEPLYATLDQCFMYCKKKGIVFSSKVIGDDFIEYVVESESSLFADRSQSFNYAIQNPPYKKIRSNSNHRKLLSSIGLEVSNLYAAFIALTVRLLEPGGELVSITPRSFCNGPYFNKFREDFLSRMTISRIHVFDSRTKAFEGDDVLQENVIVHAITGKNRRNHITVTSSSGEPGDPETVNKVPYEEVVPSSAKDSVIHVLTDGISHEVVKKMRSFTSDLAKNGLSVSTGRVVDFRAKEFLHKRPLSNDAPLIYPMHLRDGITHWPISHVRKPNAIKRTAATNDLLVSPGIYVLIKRFSSKEQKRRIEAAIYDSSKVDPGTVGFENHLNYIHSNNNGLNDHVARGLFIYLNSTLVDMYFRLFSGHTQVNATDLRNLPFPDLNSLQQLGKKVASLNMKQNDIDSLFDKVIFKMNSKTKKEDPVIAINKVQEAQEVLKQLGFPKAQSNLRSSLVLLSLLDLKRNQSWSEASNPQLGITEIMDWFAEHYGKRYAPNSRETVRRQTVHQFLDAGLVVQNPDDPSRPVNSGKNVYQIVKEALKALRFYGTSKWQKQRDKYLAETQSLKEIYAQKRNMERIPITLPDGKKLSLSPGGQNVLIRKIIDDFVPRFAPGSRLIYVGDTEDKWAYFDENAFNKLGLFFDTHGKFPDLIVHYIEKNWLLLVEAVTSHGPVNPKRHRELKKLFKNSKAGVVYVTTFLSRTDLTRYIVDISWETEVWSADSPGHMIHFDGKRFLGPYPE